MGGNADSKVIWMDGKLTPYDQAHVHVLSHSLHYGTGAFEGIRAYASTDGRTSIFRATEHFQRFIDSVQAIGCVCPFTISDMTEATAEVIRQNAFKECYIRPLAYIDDTIRGLKLPDEPKVHVAIAGWNWGKYMGDQGQKVGVRVAVSTYRRPDHSTSLPYAKLTGGYLTSVLARREATKNGMDEAILLDQHGFVAEGSGENIFVVKDGVISTPPPGSILPGITRASVMEIARASGYTVIERQVTRNELYLADEVFFTGTAVEVTPIREVDHRRIGTGAPGPITRNLFEFFFKVLRGDAPEYRRWLTYV